MELQKIINLLDITSDDKDLPRFVTKKWVEVYDQSEKNDNPNKEMRIKTSMLRSDLCDFNDAYIVVKGNYTVNKKIFTVDVLKHLIIQQLMQLLLIMQIIMYLAKKSWFLKLMHHLLIASKKIMAQKLITQKI